MNKALAFERLEQLVEEASHVQHTHTVETSASGQKRTSAPESLQKSQARKSPC